MNPPVLQATWLAAARNARAAEQEQTEPADFERLAEIFAVRGTPSVQGKPWVAADTGPANCPSDLEGWLIELGQIVGRRYPFVGDVVDTSSRGGRAGPFAVIRPCSCEASQ